MGQGQSTEGRPLDSDFLIKTEAVEHRVVNVAIVGAGLSGLVAAYRLHLEGVSVAVIEASDHVGGRTLNLPVDLKGTVTEAGGQWVGPTQASVLGIIEELGLKTFPTYADGDWKLGAFGLGMRMDGLVRDDAFEKAKDVLEELSSQIDIFDPYAHPDAEVLDTTPFNKWISKNCTSAAAEVMENMCRVMNAPSNKLSLLFVLWWLRSVGGYNAIADIRGGAQDMRVEGGSQRISNELAGRLDVGAIVYRSPVRRIEQRDDAVTVLSDRVVVQCQRVVMSAQPQLVARMSFDPPLPPEYVSAASSLHGTNIIKRAFVYKTPFWRDDGLSGLGYYRGGTHTYDNSPPDASCGIITVFSPDPDDDRADQKVVGRLKVLFGSKAASPERILRHNWASNQFTATCVSAVPPAMMRSHHLLRLPLGRLHFAGAETATVWYGYMDGAVSSGERAAEEILAAFKTTGEHRRDAEDRGSPVQSSDEGKGGEEREQDAEEGVATTT